MIYFDDSIAFVRRLITLQAGPVLADLMIQKIHYQCVTNVRIIIRIYAEINVHRANIRIYFHLFHSVSFNL